MAGLRDILALQGVIPVSTPASTAGLSLGTATGFWITGGGAGAVSPGLSLGTATGVWITGGGAGAVSPGLTVLQSSGVWVTGAGEAVAPPVGRSSSSGMGIRKGKSWPMPDQGLSKREALKWFAIAFVEMDE